MDVSLTLISNVDSVLEEVRAWQGRLLDPLLPIFYLEALMVKMGDGGQVQIARYLAIGITMDGYKEVFGRRHWPQITPVFTFPDESARPSIRPTHQDARLVSLMKRPPSSCCIWHCAMSPPSGTPCKAG